MSAGRYRELLDQLRPGRDLDWHELIRDAKPVDPVPVAATDPLYVLQWGRPKALLSDSLGEAHPQVAVRAQRDKTKQLHLRTEGRR
ncbi:hypothetical protein [Candidatus Mycobacterium methanotrophicum]|uniref:Uncharacterized protein n=1 Tax=Candidatus Mycobacterium methanotrophicum TaxID=2943498 RepID=A0ABY4QSM5_9MYCO|nr:hypothetical protein [Candidatus Mycobacterium methanotrophicum]UQX13372.1 hypothetical protein M5I08_21150 [Candidatus Mycobacterium methanotrophicum]